METQTPDVQVESSPAMEVPRDGEAYAKWRMTGELPESPAKPKAASTPAKETPAGEQPEKSAPASEAGVTQEKRRSNAQSRLDEILADLKTADLTPAQLKTFKREQKAESAAPPEKAASEQTVKPDGLKAPEKPDPSKFKTYEDLEAAKDKYYEDLADYKAQKAIQTDRANRAADAARESTWSKIREAEKRYGAESGGLISATAREISGDQQIAEPIKQILGGSDVMADLLYTIGSGADRQEFIDLARSNPGAAIRKIVLMEEMVKAELGKGSKVEQPPSDRDDTGKFLKRVPERKESEAPPPAREVSGRGSALPDPAEAAFKAGDFRSFREIENRKEIEKRRR